MPSLDDLPLDAGQDPSETPAPSAPSSPGPRVVVLVVLAAAVLAAGSWWYWFRPGQPPPGTVAASAAPAASTAVTDTPMASALPPPGEMDPLVRELLARLSAQPPLLAWLATDDLVSSIAAAIDRLAQGHSPARDLAVLRPATGFATAKRDGVTRVDPASYARYALLVRTVDGVDAAALAAAFTTIRPRVEDAYARLGHAEVPFDDALRRAIAMVATTPDLPEDAALVPGAGGYAYADPSFERLPDAQKHLLRMGPSHVRQVRDAVRRFAAALPSTTTTTR